MSLFYLLPPRTVLGDRLAGFLRSILPGLDWDVAMRANLAEAVGAAAGVHADVYVVYRDDLPVGELPGRALVDGFGAEPGDEVVEVRSEGRTGDLVSRRWRVS
jgi:hypothetical protein